MTCQHGLFNNERFYLLRKRYCSLKRCISFEVFLKIDSCYFVNLVGAIERSGKGKWSVRFILQIEFLLY